MTPRATELVGQAPEPFLQTALVLAEQIWERRVYAPDGCVTWFRPASEAKPEAFAKTRVDPFLYDGSTGIALFLAAVAHVAPERENRIRSLQALAAVRKKMSELVAQPERAARITKLGIGGIVGLGSLIYSFVRIGELLSEPDLIREAHALTSIMTPERIDRDEDLDVLSGSAGAILALLALDRALTGMELDRRPAPIEIASACARHLIARRLPYKESFCAWHTLAGFPPLAGFSHGASGILYALTKLSERTGDRQALEAARGALGFERSLYFEEQGSWRDMRFGDNLRFSSSWCMGSAGIALARLGALSTALECDMLREDLLHGLQATEAAPSTAIDYVCCGNMGRAEVLYQAFLKLGEATLRDSAVSLATQVLDRAGVDAGFRWRQKMEDDLFDPSFFTGAAGVGYALLRLSCPGKLPSVLLLE